MNNEDINPTIEDVNKMVDRLLDKNKNIEQNLAKLENQITDCKDNLAKINDKLVKGNDKIKQVEGYILDRIIQSMGKKPEVRWWHRLGDEISEKFKSLNLLNYIGILLIYFGICLFFIWFGKMFQNRITLFFATVFIFLPSFLITIVIYKLSIKILKEDHLIIKNLSVKNIWLFIQFLVVIFVVNVTLFNINESIFKVLIFFYHNSTIAKLPILIRKYLISLDPLFEESIVYLLYVVAPLYSTIFFRVIIALNKATLQSFSNRWNDYNHTFLLVIAVNYLISSGAILHVCVQDQIFRKLENQQSIVKFYDDICNDFIWYFIIIYILSLVEFIIANYKIDKKLMADWNEKNSQLKQFTDSTNDH